MQWFRKFNKLTSSLPLLTFITAVFCDDPVQWMYSWYFLVIFLSDTLMKISLSHTVIWNHFRIVIPGLMLYQELPTRLNYDDKSGTQGFPLCAHQSELLCNLYQSTVELENIDKVVGRGQNCGQSRTYRSHSSDYSHHQFNVYTLRHNTLNFAKLQNCSRNFLYWKCS